MRSRLKSNIRTQSWHIILGIIAIIAILLFFGTNLLIGFTEILDKLKNTSEEVIESRDVNYISPPVLNPTERATKEKNIEISGYSVTDEHSIELFVNGSSVDKTNPGPDKTFTFTNVPLESGENEIKAKSITKENKYSGFSEALKIKYLNKEPELEIESPTDGQVFKKDQSPIQVSGQTDAGAKVTVNDFWAIMNDNGDFYYMYALRDGDNNLKVVSTDEAGNKTLKEVNIRVE